MATPTPNALTDGCVPPTCLEIPPATSPTNVSCFSVVGYTQQPNCGGLEYDLPFDPTVGPAPTGPSFAPFLCRTWWGFRNPDGSCSQVLVTGAIAGTRPDCEIPSWLAGAPLFVQQAWCDVQRFGEQYCNSAALQDCLGLCAQTSSETGGPCFDCLAQWALSCTVVAVQNVLNRSIQRVRDWWNTTKPTPPPRDPPIPTSLDIGRLTGGTLMASPEGPAELVPASMSFAGVPHAREGLVPMVPALASCGCDEQSSFQEEEFEWLASTPTKLAPLHRGPESAVLHSPPPGKPPSLVSGSLRPTDSESVLSAKLRPALPRRIPG